MTIGRLKTLALASCLLALSLPAASQEPDLSAQVGILKHFPPHYLIDEKSGKPTGFAIDVLDAVTSRAGISVTYVAFEAWPDLNAALQNGEIDLVANLGVTEDRRAYASFTKAIETIPINLIVRSDTSEISGVEDLSGRRVSVVELNIGAQLVGTYQNAVPVMHESPEEALLTLLSGESDALIYPGTVLLQLARESGLDGRIEIVGKPLHEVKRAIAVRKDLPELFRRLDSAVTDFTNSVEYRDIFARWHGEPAPYWSATRIGIFMGTLLLVVAGALGVWHYISVVRLNHSLAATLNRARRTEEALHLRERAIEATDTGVLITNPRLRDNPIVYVNPAIMRMTGYPAEEIIGRNPRFLQGGDKDQAALDEVRAAINDETPVHVVLRNYRKDGACFLLDLQIAPVRDKDGTVTHFVGIQNDITDRVATEDQLRQAQKMEVIGQLTGGVAHDFNNLLTVIVGNLERLEGRIKDSEKSRSLIRHAQEAADLGAGLTHQLLAFARLQPLSPRAVDLNELVTDLSELLQRTLGETIQISTLLDSDLRKTLADPAQVQNALLNLAINAKDAMPRGGRLIIETSNVEVDESYATGQSDTLPGRYVMLSVTDTGVGMSNKVQERAFEPFFTTKKVGSGSGMGLSMVYGFVKQSGGHVRLCSEPTCGTTVGMYLPELRGVAKAEEQSPAAPNEPRGQGETVLVVEDNVRVRCITTDRFQELGYRVLEAKNSIAALDLLEKLGPVDLLFTDMIMPGKMGGRELAKEAQGRYPKIKVLFTSGYAEPTIDESQATDAMWLRKPYRQADLARAVRRVLDAEP
ncbi:transporter substrate-binding domain-containing protein [Pelagibius litoralis]|uniref:histidine kinase n=1 Tax=Pelagibius litoralis TaxID=374515 RepID=A0A967KDI6_9PROT|nr:transporter substrate-binding domain-containing protein [Pelagibius litoralis]NIA71444.1 transporter substrate-binding domain-containing protein [Pelagibius litoralis]